MSKTNTDRAAHLAALPLDTIIPTRCQASTILKMARNGGMLATRDVGNLGRRLECLRAWNLVHHVSILRGWELTARGAEIAARLTAPVACAALPAVPFCADFGAPAPSAPNAIGAIRCAV